MSDRSARLDVRFVHMVIGDSTSALSHVLTASAKWEEVAWAEFKTFEQEMSVKYQDGFPADYDPLTEEAFIRHHTGLALYGSLAVAISGKVEDILPVILGSFGVNRILKDGQPSKTAAKPHFGDYLFTFEQMCGCKREDVAHYGDHLFLRELANHFKHSGGKSTDEYVKQYATIAGVDAPNQDIPFDRYDWKSYIEQSVALLTGVAKRLGRVATVVKEINHE